MIRDSLAADMELEKPVAISIDAQEFGQIYRAHFTPWEYNQYIMTRLKNAGAPIEGTLQLKPKYGSVARLKESIHGPGNFDFMWLPTPWLQAINEQGGLADGTPTGQKVEVR